MLKSSEYESGRICPIKKKFSPVNNDDHKYIGQDHFYSTCMHSTGLRIFGQVGLISLFCHIYPQVSLIFCSMIRTIEHWFTIVTAPPELEKVDSSLQSPCPWICGLPNWSCTTRYTQRSRSFRSSSWRSARRP